MPENLAASSKDSVKKESPSSRKVETLGALSVESKELTGKIADKPRSYWRRLIGREEKAEDKSQPVPDRQAAEVAVEDLTRQVLKRRLQAPEAHNLHAEPRVPERIGQVVIDSEAQSLRQASTSEESHNDSVAETLSRAQLLTLSERIMIDDTNLRRIYETNLISERALRRLVEEHLRGGDVKHALQQELVEHEIDFERDPQLRDRGTAEAEDGPSSASSTLDELLLYASTAIAGDDEPTLVNAQATDKAKTTQTSPPKSRHAIDFVLFGVIAVLLTLVIILLLAR